MGQKLSVCPSLGHAQCNADMLLCCAILLPTQLHRANLSLAHSAADSAALLASALLCRAAAVLMAPRMQMALLFLKRKLCAHGLACPLAPTLPRCWPTARAAPAAAKHHRTNTSPACAVRAAGERDAAAGRGRRGRQLQHCHHLHWQAQCDGGCGVSAHAPHLSSWADPTRSSWPSALPVSAHIPPPRSWAHTHGQAKSHMGRRNCMHRQAHRQAHSIEVLAGAPQGALASQSSASQRIALGTSTLLRDAHMFMPSA